MTYLEAKADGGNDAEDGGPGGGPVPCGEKAQSKGHEALMERKPSRHKLSSLDATMGNSCPVILRGRAIAGVKAGAVSCPQLTPPHAGSSATPAPCHCSCPGVQSRKGMGLTLLPGGLGGLSQTQALCLQVVFQNDDQSEVASSQRAQDAVRVQESISTQPAGREGKGDPMALQVPGRT